MSSLAHPGGNVTGLTVSVDGVVLSAKRLELLREVVPRAMRVAVTAFPATASDTGWTSLGELLMTPRISLVAVCCSSASVSLSSSRVLLASASSRCASAASSRCCSAWTCAASSVRSADEKRDLEERRVANGTINRELATLSRMLRLGYANGKGLWSALYAPAATPREALDTLHKAVVQALNSAPVQDAFKKQMIKTVPNVSIEDAQAWNKAEVAYWKKLTEEVKVELPDN